MSSTALLSNKSSSLELVAPDDARETRCNRRIIVPRYGGPDVMTVVQEPLPEPGSGEVRVRILVAGVAFLSDSPAAAFHELGKWARPLSTISSTTGAATTKRRQIPLKSTDHLAMRDSG
jgi:hypothetical protein